MQFHSVAPYNDCAAQNVVSPFSFLYTTRLTFESHQLPTQYAIALGTVLAYLKEAFQPPDLEDAFADQDTHLEHAPPLDSRVCAFCGVSVGSFAEDDIGLFVFDLSKEFGELADWEILVWVLKGSNFLVVYAYLHPPMGLMGLLLRERRLCRGH